MPESEMSEIDELAEFNDRVGGSSYSSGRNDSPVRAAEPCPEEPEDPQKKAKNANMWAVQGPNFFPCDEAVKILAPGQYEVLHSPNSGFYFQRKTVNFDELMRLPDSASENIFHNIESFWTKEAHFREFGFLWKRGILLWGPAGSGKTSTLQLMSESIVKRGGIAVYVSNPSITAQGLAIFRRIEPKRPCVVMLEDLDAMIANHGEHDVLALLDGELQIDNVAFVATTNYPERLDKRIVNRPSRFDIVKLIGMPNAEARKMYLEHKNKRLIDSTMVCKKCDGSGTKERECCLTCKGSGETVIPAAVLSEEVNARCIDCDGEVWPEDSVTHEKQQCPTCKGEGRVITPAVMSEETSKPCTDCDGAGNRPEEACLACDGRGNISELNFWVKESEGFSIAHLKELIVSVEVFEVTLNHAVKRLRKMMDLRPSSTDADANPSSKIGQYS